MEKTLRVLGGEESSDSNHSHSHSHSHVQSQSHTPNPGASAVSTSTSRAISENGLRSRVNEPNGTSESDSKESEDHPQERVQMTSKLSAYLNLFGDFVHNM